MKLIGFNFTKVNVEIFKDLTKDFKINTSISVPEIKLLKSEMLKTEDEILGVKFDYIVDYSPDFAKLELEGKVLLGIDKKTSNEVLEMWKDKKMPENFKATLFNLILRKSAIKSLQLEDEMNLPLHFSLPSLQFQKDKEEQNN